jgi:hypothetical protein
MQLPQFYRAIEMDRCKVIARVVEAHGAQWRGIGFDRCDQFAAVRIEETNDTILASHGDRQPG